MIMRGMTFFLTLIFTIALLNSSVAGEESSWAANTHLLPQYCKDRAKGGQSREYKKWRSTLGETFIHMHHYCDGVFAEIKARTAQNENERKNWLGRVAHQMRYVSGSCKTGHVLYPDLHTRWGWALGEQGQIAEAIRHYQLAIKAKRDYTPAYAKLSDLYLEHNQPDDARKILESGLKANPKSRSLNRRLKELGTSG